MRLALRPILVAAPRFLLLCLASACGETPTEPTSAHATYTVRFADGHVAQYRQTVADFISYNADPMGALWVAEYRVGDSVTVFEFLPAPAQCPVPRVLRAGSTAVERSAFASVGLYHHDLIAVSGIDTTSRVVLDSAHAGRVWGRITLLLHGFDRTRFPATLTGAFELHEVERVGVRRHCT